MKENILKDYYVIKREVQFCPFCEEEHEVVLIKTRQTTKIKNFVVECDVLSYMCEIYNELFEDGALADNNLQLFRDQYRRESDLLTREEIVSIRNKLGMTQEDFAIILGFGEKTIARYESSTIQDKPYDILMRKFNEDANFAYEMLLNARSKIDERKFINISSKLKEMIANETSSKYTELQLRNHYLDIDEVCSVNGFALLNIEKIKSMFAYFAQFTENLFTVKAMKLFWYSDALSFVKTGKAMTGLVYQHMPLGALPIGYREIENLDSVSKRETLVYDYLATEYVSKGTDMIDDSLFSSDELDVLHAVCKRFKTYSGREISDVMHREDAYELTEDRAIIDFSIIKSLKAFNSRSDGN